MALLPFIYSSRSPFVWPDPGLRTLNFMLQPTPHAYLHSDNHNIDILCTTSDSIATELIGVFGVPILDEYRWESAHFPMLLLRFEGNGPHNADSILADACRILPITGVSRMVLKGLPTLSQSFWLSAFTKMGSLRTLGICGREAFPEIAGLVQALGKTHGGSLADSENLLPTVASTFIVPDLETLGLEQVDFSDYAGVTRFAESLARRSNQGMDLKRLEVVIATTSASAESTRLLKCLKASWSGSC
ncbi:hypothetical protein BV22DRAFT_1121388 [Leucogyrophana mollusca]|uniref:Uncharacterized protein n=1 Tax=Leucogyrophana mollusca TaxID=85980 RepID=A0ACB8BBK5_9AGAM|nr:hypothetical protein BV22DRAFT_1121388 [Leucogyrophana mollusca]